jgi:hypothetical protein
VSFGELLRLALDAAHDIAGPWTGGAPGSLARAYQLASVRRPIAEAICQRFGSQFGAPVDLRLQEVWLSDYPVPVKDYQRGFDDFSDVYGNGEFTWAGFWTVADPPAEIHDELIKAWEMYPGPITRWRLPVRDGVRLWTIDRPSDWVRLVETYPKVANEEHFGWELPGPNQDLREIRPLLEVPGQHALRTALAHHILPDWELVAGDFQGVHLSWAGFLTTEGFVSDLAHGGATMLRYWNSERTLWLEDVFGEPEPLHGPELSGSISGTVGLDAEWGDEVRTAQDLGILSTFLGR